MKLNGRLPDGDANGLTAIARDLVEHPDEKHVALVILDTKSITTDTDTGDVVATGRIRRIEPLLPDDLATARRLLERAFEKRTGKATLPFELEEDLEQAFADVDPNTGEIRPDAAA